MSDSHWLEPASQPYRFQNNFIFPGDDLVLADLNQDGFTEIITVYTKSNVQHAGSYILLLTWENKIIEQVNFAGKIIESIFTLDYDRDGNLELLVPYIRQDSLFVCLVNGRGEKLFHIFLINGQSRIRDGGVYPWDPLIRNCYLADLDHNGANELITVISTLYAHLPRGVLVHSLPQGKLLGKSIVGAALCTNFLDDFDGDGQPEILSQSNAPNNGANYGGYNDQHSYLMLFELYPMVSVKNSRLIADKYTNYALLYEDLNGDAKKELIAYTSSYSQKIPQSSKVVVLDPATLNELKMRPLSMPVRDAILTNLDADPGVEILALQVPNKILVLEQDCRIKRQLIFSLPIDRFQRLPDLNDDGSDEIVIQTGSHAFLLNPDLQIQAVFPRQTCLGVIRRGENMQPQLVVRENDRFVAGVLIQNRFYLLRRYQTPGLAALIILILLVLTWIFARLLRQLQLLRRLLARSFATDTRGFMLLDSQSRVQLVNHTWQHWLGISDPKKILRQPVRELLTNMPEILNFLNDSLKSGFSQYEKSVKVDLAGEKTSVRLILEPLPGYRKRQPDWLLTICDQSDVEEAAQAKTWCQMAQKTAHDIKNPLSAIMLKLQTLQNLYQKRYPEARAEFDPQIASILERIESLRRISQNFMKFINIEILKPIETSFYSFLQEVVTATQKTLAGDIRLELQPAPELPLIKFDPDAMRSVIENLISNAVNAMPEGGQITFSTQLVSGLIAPNNGKTARDYLLLEVQDTGTGIAEADLPLVFDPNFTRTEGGNGLGLAYVKKTV
ncbi:ATP-binding protein, partial [candidate division KSB1 bacterium]|nr:ATP-binding protein [candidate division KSB1 bacterium]